MISFTLINTLKMTDRLIGPSISVKGLCNIILFTVIVSLVLANGAWAKERVRIGLLVDGSGNRQTELVEKLQYELKLLVGTQFQVELTEKRILSSDWSTRKSRSNYLALEKDAEVDIIIAAGIISSSVVVQQNKFSKPVIAIGIVDPLQQKLNITAQNSSGVHNLSYVLFNRSISNDLDAFFHIFPYRKVAIVISGELLERLMPDSGDKTQLPLQKMMAKNGTSFVTLPVKNSVTEVINEIKDADAVYLGYLGRFEEKGKNDLIRSLNAKKIPSFGFSVTDVERGVLAATAPKRPVDKLARRLALNIEAILNGINASELPVQISFEEKLTINMKTAHQIGYSPPFRILSNAELIHEFLEDEGEVFTLKQAVKHAVENNIALRVESENITSSKLEVDLARSQNYPSVSFSATGRQIDQEHAESSFGQQAEITTSSGLNVQQLLYSESQSSNVDIQQYALSSTEYGFQQKKLDLVLESANAYFGVLQARIGRKIQRENITITRQNLNIAKQREAAGFSGRSDVYYWESQLASTTTDNMAAANDYKLSKIQFNQILNRRLDERFEPREISLTQGEYSYYLSSIVQNYVKTPYALEKFKLFLVGEAIDYSPELLQLDAKINIQKRRLSSLKKKRYSPDISLVADASHIFSRDGAGSDVAGVDPIDTSWSIGLNMSWPLYQGGSIGLDGKKANVELLQLEDQKLLLQQALELKVRASLLDLVTQAVNLRSSKRSADFAGKNLTLIQDAYTKGKVSVTELSDAQKTAIVAEQGALNSVYEYLSAILNTEYAVSRFTLFSSTEEQAAYISRLESFFHTVDDPGVK